MPNTTKNIISKFKAVHKFIGCASSFKQEAFRAFPNMDSTSRTDAHWQMRPLYFNAFRVSSWRLATYLDASFRFFLENCTKKYTNWSPKSALALASLYVQQAQTVANTNTDTENKIHTQTQPYRQTQLGRQTDRHTQACNFAWAVGSFKTSGILCERQTGRPKSESTHLFVKAALTLPYSSAQLSIHS